MGVVSSSSPFDAMPLTTAFVKCEPQAAFKMARIFFVLGISEAFQLNWGKWKKLEKLCKAFPLLLLLYSSEELRYTHTKTSFVRLSWGQEGLCGSLSTHLSGVWHISWPVRWSARTGVVNKISHPLLMSWHKQDSIMLTLLGKVMIVFYSLSLVWLEWLSYTVSGKMVGKMI